MRRRITGVGLAIALWLAAGQAPVIAVDPIVGTPLPAEPTASGGPDRPVTDALAVDLDGDGVRELLTVIGRSDSQGLAAVQAWWVDAEGVGTASNEVPLRRSASVDDFLAPFGDLRIDREGMITIRINEPAKLLVVRRSGREVPLVAVMGTRAEFVPCCLTIWEVATAAAGQLELRLVGVTNRLAIEVVAADLDADGTDELLVTEGPIGEVESNSLDVSLLRWAGEAFDRIGFTVPSVAGCCTEIADAGDSDGLPGEEVLIKAADPDSGPTLLRVSLRNGDPFVERTRFLDDREFLFGVEILFALAVGGPDSPTLLVHDGTFLRPWWWPRDGRPSVAGVHVTAGTPAAVFGSGEATRIFVLGGSPPASLTVLHGDLSAPPRQSPQLIGRGARAGAFNGLTRLAPPDETALRPHSGPFPGGLPGVPEAYVFSGRLVIPTAEPDPLAVTRDIALLPGVEPMGTVGPDGEWTALLSVVQDDGYWRPALDMVSARQLRTLRLVSTASLLEPEADGGRLRPTFFGVAPDPANPTNVIVGDQAAVAEVAAPPGSTVYWTTRGKAGSATAGVEGTVRITFFSAAGPDAPDGSRARAQIWVVTPAGHAYSGSWQITVYRQPPALAISEEPPLLDVAPTLSGRTVPGGTVTINGQPADVAADGSFTAPIQVGPLPTVLRVVAVDPVGNRTERVVTRVWPLDYRQLPFVPLAVLLTVAVGIALYLRTPEAGPDRRRPDDEASLEEIGG